MTWGILLFMTSVGLNLICYDDSMKTFLLIIGVALFVIGIQDGIRILADNQHSGIFGWVPGGLSLHIALDIVLAACGAMLAKYASPKKPKL